MLEITQGFWRELAGGTMARVFTSFSEPEKNGPTAVSIGQVYAMWVDKVRDEAGLFGPEVLRGLFLNDVEGFLAANDNVGMDRDGMRLHVVPKSKVGLMGELAQDTACGVKRLRENVEASTGVVPA